MIYYLLMSFEVGTPNLLASSCFIPTIILYLVVSNPNVVSSYPCLSWFVPKALIDLYPYCWSIHTIRKQEQLSDWNNLVIAWHKENTFKRKASFLYLWLLNYKSSCKCNIFSLIVINSNSNVNVNFNKGFTFTWCLYFKMDSMLTKFS